MLANLNIKKDINVFKVTLNDIKKILLENRSVSDEENFLNPPKPNEVLKSKNIKKIFGVFYSNLPAIKKLIDESIKRNSPIYIYGDYDVDGVSAACILWDTIYRYLGYKNCFPFIPDRFCHGYGLSIKGIDEIYKLIPAIKDLHPLLLTVDCGITNVKEIDYANKLGFKVVIIDHHTLPKKLPNSDFIFQTTQLCAAGISWVLSSFIKEKIDFVNLDIVTLATIADLQKLTGWNRSLVKYGLLSLTESKRAGIKALKEISGLNDKEITTYDVGWVLGPRLNASGRMENAMDSLRLLCTNNLKQARTIAFNLNAINVERQNTTEEIFELASKNLKSVVKEKIIIVSGEDFHEGVIGIVAQKLTQKFYRPAIVISRSAKISKASVRSVSGVDIISFLRKMEDIFENVGGHKMAAGFSIQTVFLEDFKKRAGELSEKYIDKKLLNYSIDIDLEIPTRLIGDKLLHTIKKFEPFGLGNPQPTFIAKNLSVADFNLFGKEKNHLSIKLETLGKPKRFIYGKNFKFKEEFYNNLNIGDRVDIVFTLEKNNYRGKNYLNLIIKYISKTNTDNSLNYQL